MSNIVFVTGQYYPEIDANVVCSMNVINELKRKGHKIFCLCGTLNKDKYEEIDGVTIIRIHHRGFCSKIKNKKGFIKKVAKSFHLVHSLLVFPLFPYTEIIFSIRLKHKLKQMIAKFAISCAIGVFRPYASIFAIIHQSNVLRIGYYLDILCGAQIPNGISEGGYLKLCQKKEKKIFQKLDGILMAENGREYYQSLNLKEYNNIYFLGFPTLVPCTHEKSCTGKKKLFVYAGYTNSTYRNPTFILQVFMRIALIEKDVELHFYGVSDVEQLILDYQSKMPNIIFYHGAVSKEEADKAILNCDCAINLGNFNSKLVPSKIFELFSAKKAILHVAESEDDSCIQYLSKYPNSCIIYKDAGLENAIERIVSFINKENIKIGDQQLFDTFYFATPYATVKVIEKMLLEHN